MICVGCLVNKEESLFTLSGLKKKKCTPCVKAYNQEYRKKNEWALYQYEHRRANPERHKKYRFKTRLKKYQITETEYSDLLVAQNYGCAICKLVLEKETFDLGKGKHNSFCIDHCHTTGKVRGLLCHQCNIGIGAFKDNQDLLEQAKVYLETVEKVKGAS